MADRRLTADDLLSGLNSIRLPSDAPGGLLADSAAAIGLGLLIAICLSALLPFVTKRVSKKPSPTLNDRIEQARNLPPDDRIVALLHLLKESNPALLADLKGRIYTRGGLPDPHLLETELQRETHD